MPSINQWTLYLRQKRKEHEHTIANIKIVLVAVMLVLACLFRYNGFVWYHADLFRLEVATYVGCSVAAFLFLNLVRNQSIFTKDFAQGLAGIVVITLLVVVCAEYAGLNTKFVLEEDPVLSTPTPLNQYRREAIGFKQKALENIIITVNVLFLGILIGWYMRSPQEGLWGHIPVFVFLGGIGSSLIASTDPLMRSLRKDLVEKNLLPRDSNLSNSQLGMFLYFCVIFMAFVLLTLALSGLQNLQIYSYFPNKMDSPKKTMCGPKRMWGTFFLFPLESLLVAMMFAVPILYVANNRNKPELGKDYKFFNMDNKEAFLDFGLLTFKIFVFILALQMTGLYDGFNKGFCRTKDGCNIRMPTRQQLCPAA